MYSKYIGTLQSVWDIADIVRVLVVGGGTNKETEWLKRQNIRFFQSIFMY